MKSEPDSDICSDDEQGADNDKNSSGIQKEQDCETKNLEAKIGMNGQEEAEGAEKTTSKEVLAACRLIRRYLQQLKCDFDALSLDNVERDIKNACL